MRDYFKNEDGWLIRLEKITRENIDEVLALRFNNCGFYHDGVLRSKGIFYIVEIHDRHPVSE